MVAKLFCGGDYEKSLRRRRWMAFGLLAVGLTGVVCYFLLVDGSDTLPDFARGLYLGGACGICLGSVILLVRTIYLLTHPEERKKAKIKEQDEREKAIVSQSFQFAGIFTFFGSAAALFVLAAVSLEATVTLLSVVAVFFIAFLARAIYLSATL